MQLYNIKGWETVVYMSYISVIRHELDLRFPLGYVNDADDNERALCNCESS